MGQRPRDRLDQVLVARGLAPSRARARDLVLRGEVLVGGRPASKPAALVGPCDELALVSGPADYVSRGALKLRAALAHFDLDPGGRIALDIGASTGGFTQALLAGAAARVYAVENGRGQLHPSLAGDARVVSLEGIDARRLDGSLVPEPVAAIVADVSFISLTKAVPAALGLSVVGCWLVALIKPQFELGPGLVPRDGIVKDDKLRALAVETASAWLSGQAGWRLLGVIASPIHGGDGNVEYLLGAMRDG